MLTTAESPTRRFRLITSAIAAALAAAQFGCSTRDDPRFSPYRSPNTAPGGLSRAEEVLKAAEKALDNLDRRMENVVR